MKYDILEIERQLIDALKGNASLRGVTIKIHAGELTTPTMETPEMLQVLIDMRRFILLQYLGKSSEKINSSKTDTIHKLSFRLYIGSIDVFQLSLAREDAYKYLSTIYDTIQGRWIASCAYSLAGNLNKLPGLPVTGASRTSPIVLTCAFHGKATGDKVFIRDVGGNDAANNTGENPYWSITRVDENHLSLNASVADGEYTFGGSLISAITTSGFNPQTGFIEVDGIDQRIVQDTPDILIYQTDYTIKLLA